MVPETCHAGRDGSSAGIPEVSPPPHDSVRYSVRVSLPAEVESSPGIEVCAEGGSIKGSEGPVDRMFRVADRSGLKPEARRRLRSHCRLVRNDSRFGRSAHPCYNKKNIVAQCGDLGQATGFKSGWLEFRYRFRRTTNAGRFHQSQHGTTILPGQCGACFSSG